MSAVKRVSDIMSNCLHVTTTIVLPPLSLKDLEIPC